MIMMMNNISNKHQSKSCLAGKNRKASVGLPSLACFLAFVVLIGQFDFSSARYLPTRGDESRKDLIKQLLREIMDLPAQYDQAELSRFANKNHYPSAFGSPSSGSYIAKRSTIGEQPLILTQLEAFERSAAGPNKK